MKIQCPTAGEKRQGLVRMELKELLSHPISKILETGETKENYIAKCIALIDKHRSPSGFISWNTYAKIVSIIGTERALASSIETRDSQGALVSETMRKAILQNAPARFISKELCEAFCRTPTPMLPSEIVEVFPYLHIILPRNYIFDKDGCEVFALIIQAGQLHPFISEEERARQERLAAAAGSRIIPSQLEGAIGIRVASVSDTGSYVWTEYIDPTTKNWFEENIKYKHEDDPAEPRHDHDSILRLGINSLLVHLYEPELIKVDRPASTTKGLGFARSPGKQPLPVTWIGKGFKYQREAPRGRQGEARWAVRAHWRRGHWHTVLRGPKRSERTVQWFKPVYVTGNSK